MSRAWIIAVLFLLAGCQQQQDTEQDMAIENTVDAYVAYAGAHPGMNDIAIVEAMMDEPSTGAAVTAEEFRNLDTGMGYMEAEKVIGSPGEEVSRSEMPGVAIIVMYAWKNADGSNMNAMFHNDKLVSKAQFGLR